MSIFGSAFLSKSGWDTPSGPVQLKTRPDEIITVDGDGAMAAGARLSKKYNRHISCFHSVDLWQQQGHQVLAKGLAGRLFETLFWARRCCMPEAHCPFPTKGYLSHGRLLRWLIEWGAFQALRRSFYRNELSPAVHEAAAMFERFGAPRRTQKSKSNRVVSVAGVETGAQRTVDDVGYGRLALVQTRPPHKKFVPPEYLGSSDETHLDLLRGLWEADGTVTRGSAKYSTCSELLCKAGEMASAHCRSSLYGEFYENGFAGMWRLGALFGRQRSHAFICGDRRRFSVFPFVRSFIDPAPAIFVELAIKDLQGPERPASEESGRVCQADPKAAHGSLLADCPISTIDESHLHVNEGYGVGAGQIR